MSIKNTGQFPHTQHYYPETVQDLPTVSDIGDKSFIFVNGVKTPYIFSYTGWIPDTPLPVSLADDQLNISINAEQIELNTDELETLLTNINTVSGIKKIVDPLPIGDNNIGNVDVLTLPSIPDGTNLIGAVIPLGDKPNIIRWIDENLQIGDLLLANATYTQSMIDRPSQDIPSGYTRIWITTDQSGVLNLEESHNGTNWTTTSTINVSAGVSAIMTWVKLTRRYVRVRYVNGNVDQGNFILLQYFMGVGIAPIRSEDGDLVTIGTKNDTAVIDPTASSTLMAGIKGLLKQIQGNGTGALPISNTNLDIQLSALRDALRGEDSKTLSDIITQLSDVTITSTVDSPNLDLSITDLRDALTKTDGTSKTLADIFTALSNVTVVDSANPSNLDIALSALLDGITKTGVDSKTLADIVTALSSVTITNSALPSNASTESTLASILNKIISSPSTETKQDTIIGYIDGIETALTTLLAKDFATQTTLAEILAKLISSPSTSANQDIMIGHVDGIETALDTLNGKDFATQTTLASILAKIIATPSTEAKQDDIVTSLTTIQTKLDDLKTEIDKIKDSDGIKKIADGIVNKNSSGTEIFTDANAGSVKLTGSINGKGALATVTTAGTRVQLPSFACREVTITAKRTNTGYIYASPDNLVSSTVYGIELATKDSFTFNVANANQIWIDASVSGEGISYVAV